MYRGLNAAERIKLQQRWLLQLTKGDMTDEMLPLVNLPQPWITFHKFKNKYAGIATDGPCMIKTLIGYYQQKKKERMRVRNWVQVATRPVGLSHVLHFN